MHCLASLTVKIVMHGSVSQKFSHPFHSLVFCPLEINHLIAGGKPHKNAEIRIRFILLERGLHNGDEIVKKHVRPEKQRVKLFISGQS